VRLSGQFVSGEMISFAVSGDGGNVGVGRKVVKLCSSIVSTLGQCVFLPIVGLKFKAMVRSELRRFIAHRAQERKRCLGLQARQAVHLELSLTVHVEPSK
jgi:hypothetical protein